MFDCRTNDMSILRTKPSNGNPYELRVEASFENLSWEGNLADLFNDEYAVVDELSAEERVEVFEQHGEVLGSVPVRYYHRHRVPRLAPRRSPPTARGHLRVLT